MDATDIPLHGHQAGRFFHGYYDEYCYLPLYIFCGEHLLCAKLRPSNLDASVGALDELKRNANRLWCTSRDPLADAVYANPGFRPQKRPRDDLPNIARSRLMPQARCAKPKSSYQTPLSQLKITIRSDMVRNTVYSAVF